MSEDFLTIDDSDLLSRQQLREITGVADHLIAYWSREGVLVSENIPGRTHRRFRTDEAIIAVVLEELRLANATFPMLRATAEAIRAGSAFMADQIEIAERGGFELNADDFEFMIIIARDVALLRRGLELAELDGGDSYASHPHGHSGYWISLLSEHMDANKAQELVRLAYQWPEQQLMQLEVYLNVVEAQEPGTGFAWLLWLNESDEIEIISGHALTSPWEPFELRNRKKPRRAIYLEISTALGEVREKLEAFEDSRLSQ